MAKIALIGRDSRSSTSDAVLPLVQRVALARPRVWAGIIGSLALLVRLPFMFDPNPVLQPDSHTYLGVADSVIGGHGFGDAAIQRPPGYPLFLVLLRVLPGPTTNVIVTAQHVLGVALAVAILLVAWRCFGRFPAIVAGVLAAISPQLISTEHEIMSDYFFLLVVFAGAVALAFFAQARSWRLLLIPGVVFGYATLTKPLGQSLVVVAPIALVFLLPRWKPALRAALVVTLGMALVVVPWVVRNELRHGHAVISSISDEVLFWRVFDGQHPLPFVGHDPVTNQVRRFYLDYRAGRSKEQATVWYVHAYLIRQGYGRWEAGALERKMALRAIQSAPLAFAADSLDHFDDFTRMPGARATHDTLTLLTATYRRSVQAAPGVVGGAEASVIAWPALSLAPFLTAVWWVASVFGLAGLLLLRSHDPRKRTAAVVFATMLLVLGSALALTGLPELRYNLVSAPFLWMLGSAGLIPLYRGIYRWGWNRPAAAESAASRTSAA